MSTPEPQLQRVDAGLAHWFNHQTHHRGQVHTLLTQLTGQARHWTLLVYQRQPATEPARCPTCRDGGILVR
ncbi:DinB family protein [Stenotrophomonas sp. NRRL B-14846]|uniref:DinB family protein n=1 Tax=Stenotrophomonas sp. NRRL B-14846 TaxID=3162882 RepID=UPI003D268982